MKQDADGRGANEAAGKIGGNPAVGSPADPQATAPTNTPGPLPQRVGGRVGERDEKRRPNEPGQEPGAGRVSGMNEELKAMRAIAGWLEKFDCKSADRILRYVVESRGLELVPPALYREAGE